jgi:hypothetical protein
MEDALFVFAILGIPCIIFLIFSVTPRGKKWRRDNGLL